MMSKQHQTLIAEAEEQNRVEKYAEAEATARTVLSASGIEPLIQAQALRALSESLLRRGMAKEALAYAEESVDVAIKAESKLEEATSRRNIGNVYRRLGAYAKSLEHYTRALTLNEELDNRSGVARVTGNIGNVYNSRADYARALEYFTRALALHDELGERSGVALVTGNIGNVYQSLADYAKSLEYFTRALALHEELGNRSGVAHATGSIGVVYNRLTDYSQALEYFTRTLALYEELSDRSGVARVTGSIGAVYLQLGGYARALEYFTHAIALHDELGERPGVARTTVNIGNVYQSLGDYAKALEYFTHAIALYENLGERSGVALVTGNIGAVHQSLAENAQALEYYTRAIDLHQELGERSGVALATGNIGNVYANLSEYGKALEYYTRARDLHEELGHRSGVAHIICNIGALYAQQEFTDYNPTKAEELLHQAITLNQELGTKQALYESHKALADLYAQEGRWEEAFQQFKKHHELYQEVQSEEAQKKALQVEQQRQIAEMEKRTAAERADAEATKRVLHNILPPTIAQRVVSGEERIAESFELVTVLFADLVGFTVLSQHITPTELVSGLDLLFSQFDELAEKHGLEKIKTIGDAYMAVSGLPEPREDHAESAARMAMEMVEVVKEFAGLGGDSHLQVRIGLHTGEVVAGIIGKKKFAYDLWGDAVNTAARMESHGKPGRIHVSEEFAKTVGSSFSFTERGKMEVKGKGMLRTYFLEVVS
jgi:class 3 adenylate cyclase